MPVLAPPISSPKVSRVACAASLLRWIYSMIIHGTGWDPAAAAGQHAPHGQPEAA